MVETGVSQDELRQILNQLRSYSQQASAPPQPPAPQPHAGSSNYSQSYPRQAALSAQSGFPSSAVSPSYPQLKTESADLSSLLSLTQSISTSVPTPPTPAPISNIANLYNALLKAGVVSATGTPTGAGETAKAEETKPELVDPARTAAREYRKSILSNKLKLTSAAITK